MLPFCVVILYLHFETSQHLDLLEETTCQHNILAFKWYAEIVLQLLIYTCSTGLRGLIGVVRLATLQMYSYSLFVSFLLSLIFLACQF